MAMKLLSNGYSFAKKWLVRSKILLKDLKTYRAQIDEIDKKLIDLFEQRLDIVTNIHKVKKNNDIPIVNELREAEVISQAIYNLNNKTYSDEITEYMKAIIAISRRLQLKSKDTGN